MLAAWYYTRLTGIRHVALSDSGLHVEAHLGTPRRLVRRLVYGNSEAFIGASSHTEKLFHWYGVARKKIFISPLCVDKLRFLSLPWDERKYDLLFSGRLSSGKMPDFFARVVKLVALAKPNVRVLVMGDGPERGRLENELQNSGVQHEFAGFVSQDQLPYYYAQSKVLLFPTKGDPWGIVANEACSAGVPVITCRNAGVAYELVRHGQNGYVLPLKEDIWKQRALSLICDEELWKAFSERSLQIVDEYSIPRAIKGFLEACEKALQC
jgi:glycosyltransferase involved in cell wall biosynthesis